MAPAAARPLQVLLLTLLLRLPPPGPAAAAAVSVTDGAERFFARGPESVAAPLGDEVALECQLRFPAERIRWRRTGRFLDEPGGGGRGGGGRLSQLTVRLDAPDKAGDYQCVAWFGASALASLPGRVSVAALRGSFPAPAPGPRLLEVREGATVALRWPPPASTPPAKLLYSRDGVTVLESARAQVLEASGSLLLRNVTAADAGEFRCSAFNYLTGQEVKAADALQLRVLPAAQSGPPVAPFFVTPPPDNYTVRLGENVTLECAGGGWPLPRARWAKYGGELPGGGRARPEPAGLRLWAAAPTDAGTYTCVLENAAGRAKHVLALAVLEAPQLKPLPNTTRVQEGDDVSLECEAERGSPAPRLWWLLNGEELPSDGHVRVSGGKLHIGQVQRRHAGTFQCFASNSAGDTFRAVMLQVAPVQISAQTGSDGTGEAGVPASGTGAPGQGELAPDPGSELAGPGWGQRRGGQRGSKGGRRKDKGKHHGGSDAMIPPTKPVVTRLSDTSVMVRWDVPRNDGLPIQFFKVQYREAGRVQRRRGGGKGRGGAGPDQRTGESRWMTNNEDIPQHIRSYEVDSLNPDHWYRFRIAAVYANDDNKPGQISDRFHLQRGEAGSRLAAPRLLDAEAISSDAIRIHWSYTGSQHAPAQGFYVHYRTASTAGDYIKEAVMGDDCRSLVITHLDPDTAYEMKVQSFSRDSASNFSTIFSRKTLPLPTEAPPVEMPTTEAPSEQLYVVLGATLGLAALAILLAVLVWCGRRRFGAASQPQARPGEHTGKAGEPGLAGEPGPVLAVGSKGLLNGRLLHNGFLPGKMTITSNPLADSDEDKNQNMVEMSMQNNNRACAGSSSVVMTSGAGDGEGCLHPDSCSETHSWRGSTPTTGEKYV